jgi:hypothetical protein
MGQKVVQQVFSLSREAALVARESICRNASSTFLELPSKELFICRLTDFVECQPAAIASSSSKARVSTGQSQSTTSSALGFMSAVVRVDTP